MSKFTGGEWQYSEYIPEGITLNGREYLIQADGEDVALARTESDARLIAAAPEMYTLAAELANLPDEQCMISPIIHDARKLLARIDGEEAKA